MFIVRITAGYVLDREQGNTKGLGGSYGLLEAINQPLPTLKTRSITGIYKLL